jgi:nitrilase
MSEKNASSFGRARPQSKPAGKAEPAAVVRVAAVQLASGPSVAANLNEARRLIAMAAKQGAKLVALPEYFAIMGMQDTDKVKVREAEGTGPIRPADVGRSQPRTQQLARVRRQGQARRALRQDPSVRF